MKKLLGLLLILALTVITSCKRHYTCEVRVVDTNVESGEQSSYDPTGSKIKTPRWSKSQVEAFEDSEYELQEKYYPTSNGQDSILLYTSERITTCEKGK